MIIQLAPDAPLLVRAAAGTVLVLHIGGAALGLASGTIAMAARKGRPLHRAAGNVFFGSMLTMAGAAAIAAPFLPDRVSGMMGVFTFYLAATGWATVRSRPGSTGRFEMGAMLYAWGVVAAYLWLAGIGAASPKGLVDGEQPFQLAVVFAAIAALAAGLDVRMIRRGGLSGPPRIARHLWRMSLALFITWGSFAGQPRAQPEAVRGSPYLIIPALLVLALMVFWLVRVRVPRRPRPPAGAIAARQATT